MLPRKLIYYARKRSNKREVATSRRRSSANAIVPLDVAKSFVTSAIRRETHWAVVDDLALAMELLCCRLPF